MQVGTMPGLETRRDDRTEKRIADKAKPQGHATFKQQDPWVFSCKHQPKRNIYKIMGQNKTSSQILHSACGKPKRDDFCKTLFRNWFLENNTKRDDFSSSPYAHICAIIDIVFYCLVLQRAPLNDINSLNEPSMTRKIPLKSHPITIPWRIR